MKKHWKNILSFAGVLCAGLTLMIVIMMQSAVVNAAGGQEAVSVDPVNAIIAAAVAGLVGVAVFIKRHIAG